MKEQWRPVPGFGNHYEASTLGRIRSKARIVRKWHKSGQMISQHYKARILTPNPIDKYGHLGVHIGYDRKRISIAIHRLVLLAFHGPCPEGHEACHNNGIPSDNRPDNLRWDTHLNNNRDRFKHGTYARGEEHHYALISEATAKTILASNEPTGEVARRLGVSYKIAWRIRRGDTWSHLQNQG